MKYVKITKVSSNQESGINSVATFSMNSFVFCQSVPRPKARTGDNES